MKIFYQNHPGKIVDFFKSDAKRGLGKNTVTRRQKQLGRNEIKEISHRSPIAIFLDQFKSPLIFILIIAAGISLYVGSQRDAIVLAAIIVCNSLIGFYQEYRSEKIVRALSKLVVPKSRVIREGQEKEVATSDLVPGDLVILEAGDRVPADIRLIKSNNLATNDFILTGESEPQSKDAAIQIDQEVPVSDQNNCLFMGMNIVRGNAIGIVFAIGMDTEMGQIASASEEIELSPSPLQKEIKNFAQRTIIIALIITALLFIIRLLFNDPFEEALLFSIVIAVAIVPEGLPAQMSVALSLGVNRMAEKKAVVKRMSAVETLGAATVIATDKTGTITKNEMTINLCYLANHNFSISGIGYNPRGEISDKKGHIYHKKNLQDLEILFLGGYLASTGTVSPPDEEHSDWYPLGDPTGAAFAVLALKTGYTLKQIDKKYHKVLSFPFDSDRKRMSIIRDCDKKRLVFAKGGTDSILSICTHINHGGRIVKLSNLEKKKLVKQARAHAAEGLRVLALGYKELPGRQKKKYQIAEIENELIFGGLITMMDPPHSEVHRAVQAAFRAGIKIVMITGDGPNTAKAIANMVGMLDEKEHFPRVIKGSQLAQMNDRQVRAALRHRAVVFSRVSPLDKFRIVNILKKKGEVVAVTGDGVNDTLSLKNADIGVAMGLRGSEVAREAANMILLDDNFSTIVSAIREGRTIYRNLAKTITSSLTSNFGELFCVLIGFSGAIFGLPMPILAIQILSIDLIGEMLPLTYLTTDPPTTNLMKDPPRKPQDHLVSNHRLWNIIGFGFLMGLAGFLSFYFIYRFYGGTSQGLAQAHTAAWIGIILAQFMNIISRRTPDSIFSKYLFGNTNLNFSFLVSLGFVLAISYLPFFNNLLQTAPLYWDQWLYPIAGALIFLFAHELRKKLLDNPRW